MIQNLCFFLPSVLIMSLFGLILVNSECLSAFILHSMKKLSVFSLSRMKFLWLMRWIFSEQYENFTDLLRSNMIKTPLWRNSRTMPIDVYLFKKIMKNDFKLRNFNVIYNFNKSKQVIHNFKKRKFCFQSEFQLSMFSIFRLWQRFQTLAAVSDFSSFKLQQFQTSAVSSSTFSVSCRSNEVILTNENIPWRFELSESLLHIWKVDHWRPEPSSPAVKPS